MNHVITIVIGDDGIVQGDLDDDLAIFPSRDGSYANVITVDGQARSVLDKALAEVQRRLSRDRR